MAQQNGNKPRRIHRRSREYEQRRSKAEIENHKSVRDPQSHLEVVAVVSKGWTTIDEMRTIERIAAPVHKGKRVSVEERREKLQKYVMNLDNLIEAPVFNLSKCKYYAMSLWEEVT